MKGKGLKFLTVFKLYFIFLLISALLLLLIQIVSTIPLQSINSPRQGLPIDFNSYISLLKIAAIPLLITYLLGAPITYLVSKSVFLSKIVFTLIIITALGFSALNFVGSTIPCEGFSCIANLFANLLVMLVLIIAGASLPILYLSSSSQSENISTNKKFRKYSTLILMSVPTLWLLSTSYTIAQLRKDYLSKKAAIDSIYADPNFPVYEPEYLPDSVGQLKHEWSSDLGESTRLVREYYYKPNKVISFEIVESKPRNRLSDEVNLQNSFNQFREKQASFPNDPTYQYNPEVINVNGKKAIIYNEKTVKKTEAPRIIIFTDGIIIQISVNIASEPLSREELIKIAQSLKKVN